jgi:N-acyl-D-aspartate/D-glutamate deacylase
VDLLIRGAAVYDGTGGPSRTCDVGITGDRIGGVGELDAVPAGRVVEAHGLALAPGFIDVHSHDDFAVFLTPEMDFKVRQGVTTTVVGNCGLGAAPFRAARAYLAFFGADDGRADDGRTSLPAWEDHRGYLDAVDADPPACNVAALVAHGALRLDAMGNQRRAPTDAELAQMADTLAAGLDAGCAGFSSGLIYEPGRYSGTEELVALARVMSDTGGLYATHMRDEGLGLLDAVAEAIAIGERGGVPVQISHHKASSRAAWGLVAQSLALIDAAGERGVDVTADQYPYTAGSTSLFAVVQNSEEGTAGPADWSTVSVASAPGHPEWEGRTIEDLAAAFEREPIDAAKAIVDAEGYGAVVVMHSMCEDDVRTVMTHPSTMIGSDGIPTLTGKPHPRLYGTFAKVLGHYARDERVLTLEEAVHRMTGLPAAKFGLEGRGAIVEGASADLVCFDPATVADVATYAEPRRHPTGIRTVWVNGEDVVRDGEHTGARPGRALRPGR